jgi:Fe-S cluster assembly iron-binding protein IscA
MITITENASTKITDILAEENTRLTQIRLNHSKNYENSKHYSP